VASKIETNWGKTVKTKSKRTLTSKWAAIAMVGVFPALLPAWAQTAAPRTAPAQGTAQTELTEPAPPKQQALTFEPSISADLIVSDNGNFGIAPGARSEVSAVVAPRLAFRRESSNLRFDGSIGFTAYAYTNNTQKDAVLPRLDVFALGNVVPDWVTLEASAQTRDFLATPLSAFSDGGLATTRFVAVQSRVKPALNHEFAQSVKLSASSDNAWTTYSGESAGLLSDTYLRQHAFSLSREPVPFGWLLSAEREDIKYDIVTRDRFTIDTGKIGVEYLFADAIAIGIGGGRERNRFPGFAADGDITFASMRWRPAAATLVTAEYENRFFGDAWSFGAQHRTQVVAFNLSASRRIDAFQAQLLALPRAGNVAQMIDEVLVGRFSDPVQRAQAVQDLINRRALPSQVDQPTAVYSERLQLAQVARASVALLGARNSVVFSVVRDRSSDVPGYDNVLATAGLLTQVTRRVLSTVAWNHRLSTTSSVDAEIAHSDSQGAGLVAGKAKQNRAQLVYSLLLSQRSVASLGYRYQEYKVTTDPNVSKENALVGTFVVRF
jgi:uncharacterized protein (PEP-CTERM system associated)